MYLWDTSEDEYGQFMLDWLNGAGYMVKRIAHEEVSDD